MKYPAKNIIVKGENQENLKFLWIKNSFCVILSVHNRHEIEYDNWCADGQAIRGDLYHTEEQYASERQCRDPLG
jgi:hypothetical protein